MHYTNVIQTDRRMDGQTPHDGIAALYIASRSKNQRTFLHRPASLIYLCQSRERLQTAQLLGIIIFKLVLVLSILQSSDVTQTIAFGISGDYFEHITLGHTFRHEVRFSVLISSTKLALF